MLRIVERVLGLGTFQDRLVLPFERRRKSRLRVRLESGTEAALSLERGIVLHGGDRLRADAGRIVRIEAAAEPVTRVSADDPRALARAAYHLGNRHVPLEVGDGWLKLEQDHVLEEMLIGLGMQVVRETVPFEPEAGAYGGGHHHDHHDHHHRHHGHHHHD